ncbi:hypothetical protein SO802_034321 [Lithocarpus litseifolius]|uniref:Uncharacterized protein n=1 Tax=Lithocarpus litseifolius TaxID=425828 RepID=A0AAW2BFM8_9ROSI
MDDPFASITELCHVSASQEERLRHCGFAVGRGGCSDHDANEDSDDPTQPMEVEVEVESTGIVMVSLPETLDEEEEKDDSTLQDLFQTPPEGSLLASSEEQQPPVAADDPAVDGPRAPEPNCTDGDEAVDLGKDSDLGFSEQSKKLGLSKNSDSEAQLTRQDTEIIEEMAVEENKDEEAQLSMEGSTKRKPEFPYGDTVVLDSESEEDDWEEAEEEEGEEKNQEKLREKANGSERYRVLPASMAQEENRAEGVKHNRGVIGKEVTILDVLKMLKQRCDDEEAKDDDLKSVSVLEICMLRGVTFPRPCWWPEKGFEVFDDEDE